ncbi:sodium/solute symporter [Massilia sp. TS11]|uniref:sodium:solute symporter family transporter n=1 Tax=Massilia sp. TS11 TaxID=2908003 RepID=UPI001EDA0D31|nr:sodium/solute symporter [Massilia sp. TS11]MCG2586792.1 sodium/solute symporter [Massilia sp. TS11]
MHTFTALDAFVFLFYFVIVASYGWYVYKRKRGHGSSASHDYFLAEGSLTWWAIGASVIASNISAEQFIGMSGSGFTMGMAVASYEWLGAASLLLVAVFFMPVYLRNKIYTMPQFLHERYNGTVAMIMAVFWLLLYVVVNLTSILYLGALAISSIGGFPILACMLVLAVSAVFITLGGMKVIGYTDVIQVACLVLGGLVTTWLALDMVAGLDGGSGVLHGLKVLGQQAPEHFNMIFKQSDAFYMDLPGLSVLLGGMWIVNLNYWGCNQYITQRALGADLPTARAGLLCAAFLKMLMPVIVVLPGIAAYVLHQHGAFGGALLQGGELNPDRAYPTLLNLLPAGLKGVAFAALSAAVVASLAGKANSIATIFTLDVYQKAIRRDASEARLVWIGRVSVVVAMALAVLIAPMMGIDKKGGFQYIQEYTGFVSPGIFAMFILGFFWKRTTAGAALFATIGGFLMSILLKFLPAMVNLAFLAPLGFAKANAAGVYEMPFIDRMGFVFLFCVAGMVALSLAAPARAGRAMVVEAQMFRVSARFLAGSLIIVGMLVALYAAWW